MTHQVPRHLITDERVFADTVRQHAAELDRHAAHMRKVAEAEAEAVQLEERGKPDMAAAIRAGFQAYPPPLAKHPEIALSIARDGDQHRTDYEIVGRRKCVPTAEGLAARKQEIREEVARMEHAAIAAILRPGKWRLATLEYQDASNRIAAGTPESGDELYVANHEARIDAHRKVQRHHARLEAEIEDLTLDTIDAYEPAPYGGE